MGSRIADTVSRVSHNKQLPFVRDGFETVRPPIAELNARSRHQILDRAGNQHFIRVGRALYAGCDVHRDTADTVVDQLAFAGMQSGAHLCLIWTQPPLSKRPQRWARMVISTIRTE